MRTFRALGIVGAVGLLALALAPALATAQEAPAQPPTDTVTFTLREFSISPAQVVVGQGQPITVTVTNLGTTPHNLAVMTQDQALQQTLFDPALQPGETRTTTLTLPNAGVWQLYSPLPGDTEQGMTGEIWVLGRGAAS